MKVIATREESVGLKKALLCESAGCRLLPDLGRNARGVAPRMTPMTGVNSDNESRPTTIWLPQRCVIQAQAWATGVTTNDNVNVIVFEGELGNK